MSTPTIHELESELLAAQQENERLRRDAAAMREALEDCERTLRFSPYSGDTYRGAIDKAQAALATPITGGRAMSEQNDNWAKCAGTIIRIRLLGHESYITHQEAAELRDQITAAIEEAKRLEAHALLAVEEAKRLEDPFERWWAGLPRNGLKWEFVRIGGWNTAKSSARTIWDAARKAAP